MHKRCFLSCRVYLPDAFFFALLLFVATMTKFIVVGGGLSGLSAAHTILQGGGTVTLIERNAFMGGNSTKATSGMNGAGTRTQKALGIPDTKEIFEEDTVRSATGVKTGPCPKPYGLATTLTHTSGDCIHWIQDNFGLALDTCSRLGGHSQPRTHRSKNGTTFPGMEITYALMKEYERLSKTQPDKVKLINKARVNKLLTDANGRITGCEYSKGGKQHTEMATAIIVATGGYGAGGLFEGSLLYQVRPDLTHLPTTNGEHCTGDGISFSQAIGAQTMDLKHVQVHPTGLVHQDDPDNRVKFLAAEALRGEGGIILDREGHRFCNDLGTRDYVTGEMWKHNKGPYRLLLNENSYKNIAWHCKHYCGRRVMKHYQSGHELAKDMGVSAKELQAEFERYNGYAKNGNDPWGKKFFNGVPLSIKDKFMCAIVTPVVHYTMGGLAITEKAQCVHQSGKVLPGLFAAGEATGGVHGRNRLGGSALLECVAFGRVAGKSALEYASKPAPAASGAGGAVTITIPQAGGSNLTITISGAGIVAGAGADDEGQMAVLPPAQDDSNISTIPPPSAGGKAAADAAAAGGEKASGGEYTLEEVAKHKTEKDCWVVVNGEVLDVTKFLPDHPGGKMAIMAFAGRDASEEFNMVHEEGVVAKYASETIIGKVKPSSKL